MIWDAKGTIEKVLNSDKSLKAQKNKKAFVEKLIKMNGGNVYEKWTLDEFIQFFADIVVFGGFEACPDCGKANFYYRYVLFYPKLLRIFIVLIVVSISAQARAIDVLITAVKLKESPLKLVALLACPNMTENRLVKSV
jgi:hypothetical protein